MSLTLGMLPGHISGAYSFDETHIDLRKLANFANARFILDSATGLDSKEKIIFFRSRPSLSFDALSINIGSTPNKSLIKGAEDYSIPIKPVPIFLKNWGKIVQHSKQSNITISIIGGGAGGVETALCTRKKLGANTTINLIHDSDELLPSHNSKVREILKNLVLKENISLHLNEKVIEITPDAIQCESGNIIKTDFTLLVTNSSASSWLSSSGLDLDEQGFIKVRTTLQTNDLDYIFATGDIATIEGHKRPKSGVFAVRSAKPLYQNLKRFFNNKELKPYVPQKEFLSLIGTANGTAVASRGNFALHSKSMWTLKDKIDKNFMKKFHKLPVMEERQNLNHEDTETLEYLKKKSQMRCLGCAAKVGSNILSEVLSEIKENYEFKKDDSIILGLDDPDDASIIQLQRDIKLVQSIDFIPALISDSYNFGKIAVNHSFSDIFAMGAVPHSALLLALVPFSKESITKRKLFQVLSGVVEGLTEIDVALLGGHTAEGETLSLGLSCNGFIAKEKPAFKKEGLKIGDKLILTKALGIGTLFAAEMRNETKGRWIDNAINSMLISNRKASEIALAHSVVSCTDVTGFGLIGHLSEMLAASMKSAKICLDSVPVLDGALETSAKGILSSLHSSNAKSINLINNSKDFISKDKFPLLFDPQTSGGLLLAVPQEIESKVIENLIQNGYPQASTIGSITTDSPTSEISLV